jgi:lipopolysaccharide export system permease protein
MQFLWRYVDEMVGKGLGISVLGEMFFYAALSFVPTALPLAILLASLMTFGNLGEQFELLAMKAAGISLLRIMKPMIVFLTFVAIGAFFFQNNIIPPSQVKMWTLLSSMKSKSPELDIPEKTFYNEIAGYNLYVKKKHESGLLEDVMIYDYSKGFNRAEVTVADSGRLKVSTDKLYLILMLYNGESFMSGEVQGTRSNDAIPYRKESFSTREVLIKHDGNFNRADESLMENRYVGKNLASLLESIDSMTYKLDISKDLTSRQLYDQSYKKTFTTYENDRNETDQTEKKPSLKDINFDRTFDQSSPSVQLSLLTQAKSAIERLQVDYNFKASMLASEQKEMRRHHVEMHKKFTLSFACLIFFFIGAPLGAIIRKGGLGMPVVISVGLFIFYYIIETIGTKMATNGVWEPWQGMWLSSAVLLSLGIFLTYKAANDSVILNPDTYVNAFKKLIGKRITRKIEKKDIIIFNTDYMVLANSIKELNDLCNHYLSKKKLWISYFSFWKTVGKESELEQISTLLEQIVEEGSNSDQSLVLNKLMDYPVINAASTIKFISNKNIAFAVGLFFPIGIPIYLFAIYQRKLILHDIETTCKVNDELLDIVNKSLSPDS